MKKHFKCAVVFSAFSAGTASAAVTVFEKDNFTYKLSVDLQIQLLQDSGIDEDLDVNYDDGELKNRFEYDLGNNLRGFGELDFEVAKNIGIRREEAYVGVAKGNTSFFIGSSDYATDDFGVEKNIDVAGVDGDIFLINGSDELLSYRYRTDLYSVSLSHDLEVDEDESSTDLFLAMELQGFELGFAFQSATNIGFESGIGDEFISDADTFGVSVSYSIGNYGVGIAYSSVDVDAAPDTISNIHVVGSVNVRATTEVNLGYDTVDAGDDNDTVLGLSDTDTWYLNAIYKFPEAKGFSTFAEIGQTDVDGVSGIDLGFLAGLRLIF